MRADTWAAARHTEPAGGRRPAPQPRTRL